ncbi:hypothetical protein PV327_006293 [Microctonus hyperodae]|uniref:Apoptosis-inducing factor 1, mitochondrial n=1 Tax=Microctonus hyperodae TaxID=165561 RepID=A0AA39KI09_MICHY|nr:hypothetical protein PV327_006293 [Microctonus hyperodae]
MLSCGKVIGQLSKITRNVNSSCVQRTPKFIGVINARHVSYKKSKKAATEAAKPLEPNQCIPKYSRKSPVSSTIINDSSASTSPTAQCPVKKSDEPMPPMCEEICGKLPPSGESSGDSDGSNFQKYWKQIFAAVIIAGVTVYALTRIEYFKEKAVSSKKPKEEETKKGGKNRVPTNSTSIPSEVSYLLIGGGTAAFSAFRSIKSKDPKAKVLVISEEPDYPYMRPPLSKELWYNRDRSPSDELNFKQWNGTQRSLYYEPKEFYIGVENLSSTDRGGVAVASGWKVKKIDAFNKIVTLNDGYEIKYNKCLIATGASPKNHPIFDNANDDVKSKIILFRSKNDFLELESRLQDPKVKNIAIIGGGFLGSELACAMAKSFDKMGKRIYQIYKEKFIMSQVLPEYLSEWTTKKSMLEGVISIGDSEIQDYEFENGQLKLTLTSGQCIVADQVVVAVGADANTELADTSSLEVEPQLGGFLVNAELEARRDLWVAGDAACFYDVRLGRRRIEHHDHAVISGRLAGENMTGAGKPYLHQSMFWSDLGPEVGYEAIGIVDSSLPTIGVFAKTDKKHDSSTSLNKSDENKTSSENSTESLKPKSAENETTKQDEKKDEENENNYSKGVIFYLKDNTVVGIILWNIFNRMSIARQVLARGTRYDEINEIAKLFSMHED